VAARWHYRLVNANYEVECREAIARTILPPIRLLEDEEEVIRWEAVELICSLANHGERQFNGSSTQLMRLAKSSLGRQ
jgi:hypothetical protein